ncbi:MAG TPA: prephenate dehydratase [Baekduia sp.]|nr:prephenate dehydratase [Baekduia sp.]
MSGARWAYLGPPGTNCEAALLRFDGAGPDTEGAPFRTEREAILALEHGDVDRAVVPIENALEGAVTGTLDALALDAPGVRILAELVLPIEHCLVAAPGTQLSDVRCVVSHPQALAQCRRFLAQELPGATEEAATSTAQAARLVLDTPGRAAIANARAAELYGAEILRRGIEDEHGNVTRFVLLGLHGAQATQATAAGAGAHRTTVVFWGSGDEAPGWLVRCLGEFAFRGVNLSKIESRPRKVGLGHYLFIVDCAGRADDEPVADALRGLAAHCQEVRVLGSYPAAAAGR